MSIAYRLQDYIAEHDLPWEPVPHGASGTCMEAAQRARVPPDRIAKAVVLEDDDGYFMAVIPADHRLDLRELRGAVGGRLALATERELEGLFPDCSPGAVPPVGAAYGIPTLWDTRLAAKPDVYFEGGDHRTLVHMDGAMFEELMRSARPLSSAVH